MIETVSFPDMKQQKLNLNLSGQAQKPDQQSFPGNSKIFGKFSSTTILRFLYWVRKFNFSVLYF